jgi:hypothetical protein
MQSQRNKNHSFKMPKGKKRKFLDIVKKAKPLLKKIGEQVKGKLRSVIKVACPICDEALELPASKKLIKDVLEKGEQQIRKRCKICGEVIDILVE